MSTASSAPSMSKSQPGAGLPWAGDPRAEDKTRIWKYLVNQPDGAPISRILEQLFHVSAGDESYQRDYRLIERLAEQARTSDGWPVFEIDRGLDLTHVYPAPSAFHLTGGQHYSNTDAVRRFPKDWARNFIESRGFLEITAERAEVIERQFFRYLAQIDDRWNIGEALDPAIKPDYIAVPYRTLYNSESRASDNWRRYHDAWDQATEQYEEGVHVVLTTDPGNFDSIGEMAAEIGTNFNRFMSWISRRKGERPDYIKVLEWTDAGRPHLHVILFGMSWLVDQRELSNYWGKHQGEIVDIRAVKNRRGGWLSKSKEGVTKNEKAHLGKYLSKQMPAGEPLDEIEELVGAGEHLWKTALYWTTGKQFWTCSRDLKTDDDAEADELEDLPRYSFVASLEYHDIPGYILQSVAFVRDRPPPPGD